MNTNNTSSLQNVLNNTDDNKLQSQNDTYQFTLNFEGFSINIQEVKENQPSNSIVKALDCPNIDENVTKVKKSKTSPDQEKLKKIRANLNKILQTDHPVNGLQGVTYPVSHKKKKPSMSKLEEYKTVLNQKKLQKIRENLNRILQSDQISSGDSLSKPKNQFRKTDKEEMISDIEKLDAVLSQHSKNDFDDIDKYLAEESHSVPTPKSLNSNVYECGLSNDSCTNSIDYVFTADSAKAVTISLNFDQTESEIPETPVPSFKTLAPKRVLIKHLASKKPSKVVKLKTKKVKQVIKTEPTTVSVEVKSETEVEVEETNLTKFEFVDCNVGKISVNPTILLPPERRFPVVGVQKRSRPIKDSGKKSNIKVPKTEPKVSKSELIMCTEVVGGVQMLTLKTVDMINSICDKDNNTELQDQKSSLRSRNTKVKKIKS